MKILIVDDHVLFREGLASMLRPEPDFKIVGLAGTVKEAVDLAGEMQPDIILMDFSLPDGTGTEATRQILRANPTCKIVFLTMSEQEQDLFAAIRSGARGYLLKNMQLSKLIAAIRSVERGESALSPSMTLQLMQEFSRTREPTEPLNDVALTHREMDVLRALAAGLTNQEIAKQLYLAENTVRYHVHSILEKLHLKNRREAAKYAKGLGIVK